MTKEFNFKVTMESSAAGTMVNVTHQEDMNFLEVNMVIRTLLDLVCSNAATSVVGENEFVSNDEFEKAKKAVLADLLSGYIIENDLSFKDLTEEFMAKAKELEAEINKNKTSEFLQ